MKTINFRIEGITPLILHAFTDEAQISATTGSRASAAAAERGSPREQAEEHLYRSAQDGSIIMPQPNLQGCLIDAGSYFKSGRSKISTRERSLIPAVVDWSDTEYPLQSVNGWETDTRAVKIPATGGRIQRHRPKFSDWALDLEVTLDTDELSVGLFRQIVDAAGKKVGLGDFRPARRGPFGKFCVTRWEVDEAGLPQPLAAE